MAQNRKYQKSTKDRNRNNYNEVRQACRFCKSRKSVLSAKCKPEVTVCVIKTEVKIKSGFVPMLDWHHSQ